MSNKDLFKEAIADAKAVREAALANAKVALEEALAPKLQSMLSAKLQEMEYEEEGLEDKMEEGFYDVDPQDTSDEIQDRYRATGAALEEEELEEDFDLSSILAELELEEKEISEPYTVKGTEKGYVAEAEEAEEEETEDEESEESEGKGENITDLTMDELKDIIKDIISSEMGSDEMDANMDDMGDKEEMSVNLDGEEDGNEVSISDEEEIDEEIDLEELLAELDEMDGKYMEDESMYEARKKAKKGDKKKEDDEKKENDEMNEAINTIEALRNELNEVNLLNAKLLYVNKIFKAKNLNESQKLKVIAQFDKANTAKEAKAIFESMNNAIAKSAKSTIKESLGFASKAAGVAPKKPIVDETMSRWQILAGITKY